MTTYKNNLALDITIQYVITIYHGLLNLDRDEVPQIHIIKPNAKFVFDEKENNGNAINQLCINSGLTLIS